MGKISNKVSKGLSAAIQEAKSKMNENTSGDITANDVEELLNSGVTAKKKRHRRTKAEMEAARKAESEAEDNSLFESLGLEEEKLKNKQSSKEKSEPTHVRTTEEVCEEDLKKAHEKGYQDPDFDFRNMYEKGQIIYFIKILRGGINTKELKKLKVRTIYPRMLVCNEEKSCCQCIGYEERDLIFDTPKAADMVYKTINMMDEKEAEKAEKKRKSKKGIDDSLDEENGEYEAYTSLEEAMGNDED